MTQPPDNIIEAARRAAQWSPCAKSKRGAVVFSPERGRVMGRGFNHPPSGFACDGSAACRAGCPKLCIHAEDHAIRGVTQDWMDDAEFAQQLELVHVKVVDGQVVPGGGPSCWQCSRLVVEVGLRGVWLFEQQPVDLEIDARGDLVLTLPSFKQLVDRKAGAGVWRFYRGEEFHKLTLQHERNKLPVIEDR